jgi:inorganic pyrophosphatase
MATRQQRGTATPISVMLLAARRARRRMSSGTTTADAPAEAATSAGEAPPTVEVLIEIPRWSCVKRGSTGRIDFVAPVPCPFNYGCVPDRVGLEGDLLDAVVLGPRLPRGTRIRLPVHGAIGMAERRLYDDKLICSETDVSPRTRRRLLAFFRVYSLCKRLLNLLRGRSADGHCAGWGDAASALARARLRDRTWRGPPVRF